MSEVHQAVDLNVLSVLNVVMTKHAQTKNALILVLVPVVRMPNVELITTVPFATASMDTLVIHLQDVSHNHVRIIVLALHGNFDLSSSIYFQLAPVVPPRQDQYRDPCQPSPCGPFSQCRDYNGSPSCTCLSNYMGSPPNCRPECSINSECPSNKACIQEKCRDPCPGSCGINANCNVINHTPVCTCAERDTGDPFTSCYPKPAPRKTINLSLKPYSFSN